MYFRVLRERANSPLCRGRASFFMEYGISDKLDRAAIEERREVIRRIVVDRGLGPEWELEILIDVVVDKRSSPSLRFDTLTAIQSILAEYVPDATLGSRVKALVRLVPRRPMTDPVEGDIPADAGLTKTERARVDQSVLEEAERTD